MTERQEAPMLTDSLEDYLETVYELVREKRFARVKDIAKQRNVRPGSVSPAMRRLAELGLIEYVRREYISLTKDGEDLARRIVARHQLLCRLFEDVLQMPSDAAEQEACSMEHSLSDDGMDRLVRFFEFLRMCPEAKNILEAFHECQAINQGQVPCESCELVSKDQPHAQVVRLCDLRPGEKGKVAQITGLGKVRQGLLDMGIMPDVVIEVDRIDSAEQTYRIRFQGFELSLNHEQACVVMVRKSERLGTTEAEIST